VTEDFWQNSRPEFREQDERLHAQSEHLKKAAKK
jgi:hypothetical protein